MHEPAEEALGDGRAVREVAAAAAGRLDRLSTRLAALHPDEASREDQAGVTLLLDRLERLVFQARRRVDDLAAQAIDPPEVDEASLMAVDHLTTMRQCVGAIERACTYDLGALGRPPQRDFEPLIGPFTELARAVSGRPETEVVFEATERFMYRVFADAFEDVRGVVHFLAAAPFSDPAPDIEDRFPPLALIAYPVRADDDTFGHAVVAHEVAHLALARPGADGAVSVREKAFELIAQGGGDVEAPASTTDDPAEISGPKRAGGTRAPQSPTTPGRRAEGPPGQASSGRSSDRLKNWLDELACDVLAVRMMGPAYYFALVEFAMPSAQIDHFPASLGYDTHPSVVWRLERMRDEAEKYLDRGSDHVAMKAVVKVFDEFNAHVALQGRFALPTSPAEEDERVRVLAGVESIEQQADELLGRALYTRERFLEDLDLVWAKLKAGIAPVERIRGRRLPWCGDFELPLTDSPAEGPRRGGAPSGREDRTTGDWSRPLDWRSILNGCYVFYLSGTSAELDDEVGVAADRRGADCLMCRGSIELSEYLRRMLLLQKQFSDLDLLVEQ